MNSKEFDRIKEAILQVAEEINNNYKTQMEIRLLGEKYQERYSSLTGKDLSVIIRYL